MAFEAIYRTQAEIPTEHVEHYVEVNGAFHLDTDFNALGLETVAGVQKLKNANERLKTERNTFRSRVSELEPLTAYADLANVEGFNPADIESLMAAQGGADKDAIDRIERKYGKQIDGLTSERDAALGERDTANAGKSNYIINMELQSAAVRAGVHKDSLTDVVDLNRSRARLVDNKVTFVDADGDPTVTPLEYFEGEYKTTKSHFYITEGSGGSGNPSNAGGTGGAADKTFNKAKTTDDKVEAIRQKRIAQGKES
jgi:hypothetical protein